MSKLIIGFLLGTVFTYWVHPFARVATYVKTYKEDLSVRSDNYKKCAQQEFHMNGRGIPEIKWECKNGDVFYTTSEFRVYYEGADK